MFHSEQKVETRSKEIDKSTENFLSNVVLSCSTIFMVVTVHIYFNNIRIFTHYFQLSLSHREWFELLQNVTDNEEHKKMKHRYAFGTKFGFR